VLAVGDAGSTGFDRVLGLRLEIIPEADPLALTPGESLPCRVFFEGRPAAGLLLQARSASGQPSRARTDAEGRTRLTLDAPGLWVIDRIEMIQAPKDSGADWDSLW